MEGIGALGTSAYGLRRILRGVDYTSAVARVRETLAAEGFGVLTEIDVKATLKKKLDKDVRDYIILGACNPPLAYHALSEEAPIGLLLPCNVVVSTDDEGNAVVAAIDPVAMFAVVGRPDIEPLAHEVKEKLERALDALGGER